MLAESMNPIYLLLEALLLASHNMLVETYTATPMMCFLGNRGRPSGPAWLGSSDAS
jgi:hypothetical protein